MPESNEMTAHDGDAPNRSAWDQLVDDIFRCTHCATLFAKGEAQCVLRFVKRDGSEHPSHYRFPIIGASGKAEVLILGVCPRYTDKIDAPTCNRPLHEFATSSLPNFKQLARNFDENGLRYIREDSVDVATFLSHPDARYERFYKHHVRIAAEVYARPFEEVAVATEFFLCAMRSGAPYALYKSPCAEHFLLRTIKLVQPEFIMTCHPDAGTFFTNVMAKRFSDKSLWVEVPNYRGACVLHVPQLKNDGYTSAIVQWAIETMCTLKGRIFEAHTLDLRTPNLSLGWPQQVWIYEIGQKGRKLEL